MALIEYQVLYGADWSTATNVAANVQSVTLNMGRQHPLDQYNANTGSVVLRYPTGYASPNSFFVTNTFVKINVRMVGGSYETIFYGRISDVEVEYGIPYAAGVGVADYVILSLEGGFAAWGRVAGKDYAMAANTLGNQIDTANTQTGLIAQVPVSWGGTAPFPATTITGTWGDWVNECLLTMNGRMLDGVIGIVLVNQYYKAVVADQFSDTTNNATNHIYEQIKFASYADNYYTQVSVDPESYPVQTVQQGAAPYRTYTVNTLNNSSAQALDYANYLLSTYGTRAVRITSLTCNLNAQNGAIPTYGSNSPGTAIKVLFRGTTFNCVIEGCTWSGTPDNATVTYYFSAQDLNNYFILDNGVYGALGSNKLGY